MLRARPVGDNTRLMPARLARHLLRHHRTPAANLQLGGMLAWIAGAANASGFLVVHQYTSHMTGMVSSLADALALGQLSLASSTLISIACFVLGSACCALCVQWARRRVRHEYALALLIQAVLMLLFGLLAGRVAPGVSLTLHMTAWSLCLMMGWQNAMITKLSHAEIRTTHVTGLLTDIGIGLGRWLGPAQDRLTRQRARRKLAVQAAIVGLFFIGGLCGAWTFQWVGVVASVPLALLLIAMALAPLWDDWRAWHRWQRMHRVN